MHIVSNLYIHRYICIGALRAGLSCVVLSSLTSLFCIHYLRWLVNILGYHMCTHHLPPSFASSLFFLYPPLPASLKYWRTYTPLEVTETT